MLPIAYTASAMRLHLVDGFSASTSNFEMLKKIAAGFIPCFAYDFEFCVTSRTYFTPYIVSDMFHHWHYLSLPIVVVSFRSTFQLP